MAKFQEIADEFCASHGGGWTAPAYVDAGASAEVYSVTRGEDRAALKVFDPAFFQGDEENVSAERIRRQQSLIGKAHQNLVSLFDAGPISRFGTWYILMEFVPPPTLKQCLGDIPVSETRPLIRQLANVVRWLEDQQLCHRDIKPANIAIKNYTTLKLLDLGILRDFTLKEVGTDQKGQRQFISTLQYSPPEYIIREQWGTDSEILHALNIYQVGAILHDLLVKSPIFEAEKKLNNKHILAAAIREKAVSFKDAVGDNDLVQLALDCLQKDPKERIRRVTWDRFFDEPGDLSAARERLRLRRAASDRRADNFGRLRIEKAVSDLLNTAVAALQSEQVFGPHESRLHGSSASLGGFTISVPTDVSDVDLRFNVSVKCAGEAFEAFVEGELARRGLATEPPSSVTPILTSQPDELNSENVRQALADEFVRVGDKAQGWIAMQHSWDGFQREKLK